MKSLYYLILLFITSLLGCIRDPVFQEKAYIENQTGYDIQLVKYGKNSPSSWDTIRMKSNEKKEVYSEGGMGRKKDPNTNTFSLWKGQPVDSVVVSFNESIKVTHLAQQHQLTSRKNLIFYNDARNVLNPKSYTMSSSNNIYTINYIFTVQDYLNSQ